MRVTVTGASGLIGSALVAELRGRGAQVTVLSRDPSRAREALGVEAVGWDPLGEPAPVRALAGADAVVNLAGENIAQRWSARAKRAIRESRVVGTRNLIAGLKAAGEAERAAAGEGGNQGNEGGEGNERGKGNEGGNWAGGEGGGEAGREGGRGRSRILISGSAVGYYGPRGEEPLDEDSPAGNDFLAETCVAWEAEARRAEALGMRVVVVRTGVVLDRDGGALAKMLPPFRLGVGGPVAGGEQYMSWIHRDDLVGMICAALEDERWDGPVNGTAPAPARNREFSHALGHALHRPSLLPVPGFALGLLYGRMAEIVTTGARAMPAKPLVLGYEFRHPELGEALQSALGT
ncbi:MAG: TIGR01777 family oxidoreductase [Solirubrobacteraceae bacterium]